MAQEARVRSSSVDSGPQSDVFMSKPWMESELVRDLDLGPTAPGARSGRMSRRSSIRRHSNRSPPPGSGGSEDSTTSIMVEDITFEGEPEIHVRGGLKRYGLDSKIGVDYPQKKKAQLISSPLFAPTIAKLPSPAFSPTYKPPLETIPSRCEVEQPAVEAKAQEVSKSPREPIQMGEVHKPNLVRRPSKMIMRNEHVIETHAPIVSQECELPPKILETLLPGCVLVIYTGGTIGMKVTSTGFAPCADFLFDYLASSTVFHDPELAVREDCVLITPPSAAGKRIAYEVMEFEPLMDSSFMDHADWAKIAYTIDAHYNKYSAFVVLHGTDTMAYTASALSFMLQNLGKPVILTGSMVPLSQPMNDGIDNLLGALTLASHYEFNEVCLYFSRNLMRGCRSQKANASEIDAFRCRVRSLAVAGTQITFDWSMRRPPPTRPFRLHCNMNTNVVCIRLYPGISHTIVRNMLASPTQGAVLLSYGAGNAPITEDFLGVLAEATRRGVLIVNCTQCWKGNVGLFYQAGTPLYEAGVKPGYDMTPEAALTKLCYLLSDHCPHSAAKGMELALVGEMTSPESAKPQFEDSCLLTEVVKVMKENTSLSGAKRTEISNFITHSLAPVLLCSAAAQGDVQRCEELLRAGVNPRDSDYDRRTALHLACSEGHAEVARMLVQVGADIHARDRWNNTPLQDSLNAGFIQLAQELIEMGARLTLHGKDITSFAPRVPYPPHYCADRVQPKRVKVRRVRGVTMPSTSPSLFSLREGEEHSSPPLEE